MRPSEALAAPYRRGTRHPRALSGEQAARLRLGCRVSTHVANVTAEQFLIDPLRCDGVCWYIMCIGEAAGKIRQLRPELAARYPDLKLSRAYAMRNRLAHGYDVLDIGVVWQAASVPGLVKAARLTVDAA